MCLSLTHPRHTPITPPTHTLKRPLKLIPAIADIVRTAKYASSICSYLNRKMKISYCMSFSPPHRWNVLHRIPASTAKHLLLSRHSQQLKVGSTGSRIREHLINKVITSHLSLTNVVETALYTPEKVNNSKQTEMGVLP